MHDVLPERDVGARLLTSSLVQSLSGPLFPTAEVDPFPERGGQTFSVPSLERGNSWVSAGACAAPGLSLLPVVPKTEKKALWASSSQDRRMDYRNRAQVLAQTTNLGFKTSAGPEALLIRLGVHLRCAARALRS